MHNEMLYRQDAEQAVWLLISNHYEASGNSSSTIIFIRPINMSHWYFAAFAAPSRKVTVCLFCRSRSVPQRQPLKWPQDKYVSKEQAVHETISPLLV